jgi:glycosyltransferase involved in cell wall biosynthesis
VKDDYPGVASRSPNALPCTPTRPLPLCWLGPLWEVSGYADEGRAYLIALEDAGYEVSAFTADAYAPAEVTERQRNAVARAVGRPLPAHEFVLVHHLPGGGVPRNANGPSVARTMFETDSVPSSWLGQLAAFDEVWVPTQWNATTFARSGVPADRLHVLPETIDAELFTPAAEPLSLEAPRQFVFLTNFDFTDRKGWDVLLDAWCAAFDEDEDVCLVLKCLGLHVPEHDLRGRIEAHVAGRPCAPIVLRTDTLPVADLPRLYAAADAFVLASRGEGWGRPYMEAMAMGLPTIGTRFSGNLAFMTDDNSYLVEGELVPVPESAQAHTTLYEGHRWLDPDRTSLASALRQVFDDREPARVRAARARSDVLEQFGPNVVAGQIAQLVDGALARWRAAAARPLACVWRGDFGSGHSLAVVNDGLSRAIERDGYRVLRRRPDLPAAEVGVPGVAQQWPPSFDAPSQGPFVLYQPWEFGAVPALWAAEIRRCVDEVWVPSESTRSAFLASGVCPELVHVVPNGVDLDRFTPDGDRLELSPAGTVFLFVGGTIHRKGIDVLLAAYAKAFTADDDVCLVVKSFGGRTLYRGMGADEQIKRFAAMPSAPAVSLFDGDVPYANLPALYRGADVLVQPYRAEGFCLPALEALACGVPVVVTAGGPTDEFTTDDCAWYIPAQPVPLPPGSLPPELALAGEGHLLEPDADVLTEVLRDAADPARRAVKAANARSQAERFPWERGAEIARTRLAAISDRTPVRRVAPAVVPGRRRTLFAVVPDWEHSDTWVPAVLAYARTFSPSDDTTLVLPAADPAAAGTLVEAQLRAAGLDPSAIPDVVLADGVLEPAALELAADAVVVPIGHRSPRALRAIPADPDALRTVAGAG